MLSSISSWNMAVMQRRNVISALYNLNGIRLYVKVPYGQCNYLLRTVTYTSIYSDSEPWRFQWVSDDELEAPEEAPQYPEQAPPSPDYVPGPEHPPSPDYVPSPKHTPSHDYVPGPECLKYLVPSDDKVPIEDQPLPADALPTTLSLDYVSESDPSGEDPEEDPAEYPTDEGDDDDADDDEEDEDEEEEHLDPADYTTLPVVDPVSLSPQLRIHRHLRPTSLLIHLPILALLMPRHH
ncbi:hypothetical protein Tco_0138364 [Tanacetum coccineum]